MIGSLLSFNHVIDALLALIVCLAVWLAAICLRRRRLEKLLLRIEQEGCE